MCFFVHLIRMGYLQYYFKNCMGLFPSNRKYLYKSATVELKR